MSPVLPPFSWNPEGHRALLLSPPLLAAGSLELSNCPAPAGRLCGDAWLLSMPSFCSSSGLENRNGRVLQKRRNYGGFNLLRREGSGKTWMFHEALVDWNLLVNHLRSFRVPLFSRPYHSRSS